MTELSSSPVAFMVLSRADPSWSAVLSIGFRMLLLIKAWPLLFPHT